jgi:hypothetical protein
MAIARLDRVETRTALQSEDQLRVAAKMLSHTAPGEVSAITVVGVLGQDDDLDAFNALVAQIEDELDLDAEVALHVGSFSVRFSPRAPSN